MTAFMILEGMPTVYCFEQDAGAWFKLFREFTFLFLDISE